MRVVVVGGWGGGECAGICVWGRAYLVAPHMVVAAVGGEGIVCLFMYACTCVRVCACMCECMCVLVSYNCQ
jgi:hypothetical protein